MSKRILGGIGRAMHGLGTDIATRDAQAARDEFQVRRDAAQFARQQSLARLQDQFATRRQERGWERDDVVRADDRQYTEGRDELARQHKLEDDKREFGQQRSLIDYRAEVDARNRAPEKPQSVTAADGRVLLYDPNDPTSARPLIERVAPGGDGVGPPAQRPVRVAGKGKQWRIGQDPRDPSQLVLIGTDGDMKALPKIGPDWKVTVGAFGDVTAVNNANGESAKYNQETGTWDRMAPPVAQGGAAPAPAPGGAGQVAATDPSDPLGLRTPADPSTAVAGGDKPADKREPLIPAPPPKVDPREGYARSPQVVERLRAAAQDTLQSGDRAQIRAFWVKYQDDLKAADPRLANQFAAALDLARRTEVPPKPLVRDPRAAEQDAFVGRAQGAGVPGVVLGGGEGALR